MSHQTEIGKDILEMLMFSLYPEAETIYREYLQNASDSIREARDAGVLESMEDGDISIQIDKMHHRVTIQDNGIGISANDAESTLKDIAKTNKRRKDYLAGYYGIGRLVGAGYCRQLIFETSAKGEGIESRIEFDVDQIRDILKDENNDMGAATVIDTVTSFSQKPAEVGDHYFRVILNDILQEYPELLDEFAIRDYLTQVAPVDYLSEFKINLINTNVTIEEEKYLPLYNDLNRVKVSLNNFVNIKKPYGVRIDGTDDQIYSLRFFTISSDNYGDLAWGWYAITEFTTQIPDTNPNTGKPVLSRGMRLRIHNIQIGNQNFFDGTEYFKQTRSNKYFNGEIHIIHPNIKPTTDRSDIAPTAEALEFKTQLRAFFNEEMQAVYQSANKVKKQFERYKDASEIIASSQKSPTSSNSDPNKVNKAIKDQKEASAEFQKQYKAPRAQKPGVKAMLDVYQKKMDEVREESGARHLEEPINNDSGQVVVVPPKQTLTEEMEAMTAKFGSEKIDMLKKVFELIDRHTPTRIKDMIKDIKAAVLNDLKNE